MAAPRPLLEDQRRLLVRHFFGRFFDRELVPPGSEAHITLIQILAILTVPGVILFFNLMTKYARLSPALARLESLDDRFWFLYFSMVTVGFVTLFEWDALFLDRRDYSALLPLPIRPRTLLAAKLVSLWAFLFLFALFVNGIPTVLYPLIASGGNLIRTARFMIAHALASFAASAFVFLSLVSLHGLLLNLLGPAAFVRLSRALQVGLIIVLVSIFFLMPAASFRFVEAHGLTHLVPPAWFLGVYEWLVGGDAPGLDGLARRGLIGLAVAVVTSLATGALSFRRYLRGSLEMPGSPHPRRPRIERFLARRPQERAVLAFVIQTIGRSPRHRVTFGTFLGVGVAFVVMGVVTAVTRQGPAALVRPQTALLSAALVMNFFILVGMRVVFTIPCNLESNWVFRLAPSLETARCRAAVRRVMLLSAAVPLALLLPAHAFLWGWQTACLHALYAATLAALLAEALLTLWNRVPFTCPYVPGRANLKLWWVVYVTAFTTYAYTLARLEERLLARPVWLAAFCAAALAVLAIGRRWRGRTEPPLIYDAQPAPAVEVLRLAR